MNTYPRCYTRPVAELAIDRFELPFLSVKIIRLRAESAERRATEERAKAVDAFRRRPPVGNREPRPGPTGWRLICLGRIRSTRLAQQRAAFYRQYLHQTERAKP